MEVQFEAELWLWSAKDGSWHFVTVPEDLSDEIDEATEGLKAGFGSVPVEATIGTSTWRTSIFPSKEQAAFVLPVKKAVRDREGCGDGDRVAVRLSVVHRAGNQS